MRTSLLLCASLSVAVICGLPAANARAAEAGNLYVGAARVDITPAPDAALPMSGYAGRTQGFQRIHDHIYVRAIVLSNGTSKAVLLSWELIFMPNRVWEELSQRISKELGIPAENQMLAGEHDHDAPSLAGMFGGGRNSGRTPNPGFTPRTPSPGTVAYTAKVENDAFEAVRRAQENLRPAKFGFGTGKAWVNMNRREYIPGHGWDLGYNPDGPSDKTVAVLRFDDATTGKPIAVFINYPVHGVVMGDKNLAVSGDLPGATSRFVEEYYQGKQPMRGDSGPEVDVRPERTVGNEFVAVWTSGAAGDQNPIVMDSGEDFSMVDALGRILGEESVRVANSITRLSQQVTISGAQEVVTCPGRRVAPGQHPANRQDFKFDDADPVNIRLSLLRINDVAVSGVSGEVLTTIYQHLMRETPWSHTVMVTHANGSSGYIPNDAAFDQVSYEVTTSRLKPGCAEDSIVNGILDLGTK